MRGFGYAMETHFVTTQDGYRLCLERAANPGRQPVFVAHGMQTGSPAFVMLGRGKALVPMLHDAGFDVWMINFRGTHYSQGHNKYSTQDEEFWNFSWHEHGVFDNPAAIDYVLARTRFPSVMYAGHSMGSTSFMVMAAVRPEYQRKVRAAFLLAPAGPLHRHTSPVVGLLYALNNVTQPLVETLGLRRTMLPTYRVLRRAIKLLLPVARPFLYMFTYAIVGYKHNESYYETPHFWDTIPSGGSWGEVFHYVQNANYDSQGFRQYDHGPKRNRELYGTPEPPQYNLTAIRTPVYIYLAKNDILCQKEDMLYVQSRLPNVVGVHVDEDDTFNHIDFFASPTVSGRMNSRIVADMLRHSAEFADKDNKITSS
ncbi:lipase 3-like isoform X2 [Thrips palmi]|nr:lipase 3-like isoform X2 [Thrips palmi]